MYRTKDVAKLLSISEALVYALVAAGEMQCHRIGLGRGCLRISQDQLDAYLQKTTHGPAPTTPVQPARLKPLKNLSLE